MIVTKSGKEFILEGDPRYYGNWVYFPAAFVIFRWVDSDISFHELYDELTGELTLKADMTRYYSDQLITSISKELYDLSNIKDMFDFLDKFYVTTYSDGENNIKKKLKELLT